MQQIKSSIGLLLQAVSVLRLQDTFMFIMIKYNSICSLLCGRLRKTEGQDQSDISMQHHCIITINDQSDIMVQHHCIITHQYTPSKPLFTLRFDGQEW